MRTAIQFDVRFSEHGQAAPPAVGARERKLLGLPPREDRR